MGGWWQQVESRTGNVEVKLQVCGKGERLFHRCGLLSCLEPAFNTRPVQCLPERQQLLTQSANLRTDGCHTHDGCQASQPPPQLSTPLEERTPQHRTSSLCLASARGCDLHVAPGPAALAAPPALWPPGLPRPSGSSGPPARSVAGASAAPQKHDLGRQREYAA